MQHRALRFADVLSIGVVMALSGCASPPDPSPFEVIKSPASTYRQQLVALEKLDATASNDAETIAALKDIVGRDRYQFEVRKAAFSRLEERDLDGLKVVIRRTLPRTDNWGWVTWLSETIADRGWKDLSPALVSSWANQVVSPRDDLERPEYKALAKLHGADNVTEVVFQMFVESREVSQQGLRTRCWDLLHRLGQRERLVQLLASADVPADDAMLVDLQKGASELGIVPHNREEILWMRKLREPSRAEFWAAAVKAVNELPPQRKIELELRDIPIIVSASLHDPELLAMSREELRSRLHAYLRTQKHYVQESDYGNFTSGSNQRLSEYDEKLTWGDLAAMLIAIRAVQIPQVVTHLFSIADRDKQDTSTEYGGVIVLDGKNRIEVREFAPVMRRHDQEFISSQAMLDAAYTSIFHFHFHAQNYRNDKYAGPGFGDVNYADNTRANCLVFTFMNKDVMNVDFYRHDRVVVDLGTIARGEGVGSRQ